MRNIVRTITSRTACAVVLFALLVGTQAGVAGAETRVRHALGERHEAVEHSRELRRRQAELRVRLPERIAALSQRLATTPLGPGSQDRDSRRSTLAVTARNLSMTRIQLRRLNVWTRAHLHRLHARYETLQAWLDRAGIFRVCPVPAHTVIHDNFGVMVRLPHVPIHRHQGNDIEAPSGSAIVAPFDGYASTSHSELGGTEIRVFGVDGYVYNAHASRLGRLGWVSAGDVVGYVGVTGDATGPHDHLEWHPQDGAAQDPYPFLVAACVDAG